MTVTSKKITVNMNKRALTDFVMRSYYCKLSGIMSIILGLGGLVFLVWNLMSDNPTMRNILLFFISNSVYGNVLQQLVLVSEEVLL